jgi:hypothetical protein
MIGSFFFELCSTPYKEYLSKEKFKLLRAADSFSGISSSVLNDSTLRSEAAKV